VEEADRVARGYVVSTAFQNEFDANEPGRLDHGPNGGNGNP
jgi:hypothetical protein